MPSYDETLCIAVNRMKYRHYELEEFHIDCKRIARQLVDAEYYPDYWIALDRGGVIAAATIRREFQNYILGHKGHLLIKHKDENWWNIDPFKHPANYERKILLIDDIIDFGLQYEKSVKEFDEIKRQYSIANQNCDEEFLTIMPRTKHAALIWNITNKCNVRADFYGQTIDKEKNPADNAWIKFWWEGD